MADLENFLDIARELLTADRRDAILYERTQRVLRACEQIAALPELADRRIDRQCLFVAAIFHEVGAAGAAEGADAAEIRRRSAERMAEHAADMLPARQIERIGQIIRESSTRGTALVEAQVLNDAISLDEIGAMGVWHELRRYLAAGRGVAEALISWQRKIEYNYFQARLKDNFRFEPVRRLARRRLQAVTGFMEQLKREHFGEDVAALVRPPADRSTQP
jgi:hypothetical protein